MVEGRDEINHALSAGLQPRSVFTSPELVRLPIGRHSGEVFTVHRAVFEKLSYRDNPDGWLAVFPAPKQSLKDLSLPAAPLLIVAESIDFYRSSEVELAGDRAPRTTIFEFRSLPPGTYQVTATLIGSDRETRAWVQSQAIVVGGDRR
ncbi:MAG: hypothetical protein PVSMB1_13870 [Gemmatimonadaceae bacterium]